MTRPLPQVLLTLFLSHKMIKRLDNRTYKIDKPTNVWEEAAIMSKNGWL